MKQAKYYVVWKGLQPGIYASWADCKAQVQGVEGALYKSFATEAEARSAYDEPPHLHIKPRAASRVRAEQEKAAARDAVIVGDAWAVDAACSGNPGPMEYRCVDLADGKEVFHFGPIYGTNNIGEFLAIVHGLALSKQQGWNMPIYSDSVSGMAWVRNRKAKTTLARTEKTAQALDLVARAENWLRENGVTLPVLKWDTEQWGEIPADFGRK